MLSLEAYDYELPPERIAQSPAEPRDASRLMVVHRATRRIEHRIFREIVDYLRPGDLLVFNDTRVIPARLFAIKPTGGRVELLLVRRVDPERWWAMIRGRRVRPGVRLQLLSGNQPVDLYAEVETEGEGPLRLLRFSAPPEGWLERLGVIPLPPYIRRPLHDPERYQTVYARVPGSVAAPTAGLHFTPELLARLRDRGVRFAFATLHISLDTFRPIAAHDVREHKLHREWCVLPVEAAELINRTRLEGGRIIAVGTTVVRVLETAARRGLGCSPDTVCPGRAVGPFEGETDLYIYPGFQFRVVDALITNFHLPRSTLLLLVAAFMGYDLMREAYQIAIAEGYRFYSFGDAMLIL
ncbi:MAG: tRNA preQ1(34) S-adenosylmethionine ribosyltransferase-isomerase QueA [Thermoflexus sp.]